MAYLVETIGSIGLLDPYTLESISSTRPGILHNAEFVNMAIGRRQLKIISADLPEKVTDKEFNKFWNESAGSKDRKGLAVESFLSKYTPSEAPDLPPKVIPKKRQGKRK